MPVALAAAGTALLLYAGISLIPSLFASEPDRDAAAPAAVEQPAAVREATRAVRPARAARSTSTPVGVRIPAVGVDAPVIPLGLQEDRTLEVPERADEAGWWSGGSRPDEPGPTVIVAHRDSAEGPAVFYDVPGLDRGAEVWVVDQHGQETKFVVQRVEQHARDDFPTEAVYGSTKQPTLRLLTCGGDYDPDEGYEDNYVVFATAA